MDLENFKYALKSLKKCDQYWDEMKPVSGGRMCNSCKRKIVDFSKMTYTEIAVYMSESEEAVCGFYLPEQLKGSSINKSISVAIGLGTLFLASNVSAKHQISKLVTAFHHPESTLNRLVESSTELPPDTTISIRGTIMDSALETLPGVSIILKGSSVGAVSNIDGKFMLRHVTRSNDSVRLVISSIGFLKKEIALPVRSTEYNLGNIILQEAEMIQFYVTKKLPWHKRQWRKFINLFR